MLSTFAEDVSAYAEAGWPGMEVGWALLPRYWGRGYATEAGRASLDFAWSHLRAKHVISLILPENRRSIRVAERIGERFERKIEKFGQECLIYGINRPAPL